MPPTTNDERYRPLMEAASDELVAGLERASEADLDDLSLARSQARMWWFHLLDVQPAIAARRRKPREDVISHLLAKGYRGIEILIECITYGAAGMATTREFISMAAWHLLEDDGLQARYLEAEEAERHRILHEILRLEPVVGHLYRRAVADLEIEDDASVVRIPAGALLDFDLRSANADAALERPHRELRAARLPAGGHARLRQR